MNSLTKYVLAIVAVALIFIITNEVFRAIGSDFSLNWISFLTFLLGFALATKLTHPKS
ncbi:MAG: hypothetical protein LAT84_08825 [Balneolia bacterium]|nr:hypothetical protein [Balneolia bacterium]